MTINKLRSNLPTMVVWMASEAVMEGVRSHHDNEQQHDWDTDFIRGFRKGVSENGVRVAAEVLWKLFASCSAECQSAISIVAKNKDGYCGYPVSYFDSFVVALEEVQGHPVRIREKE